MEPSLSETTVIRRGAGLPVIFVHGHGVDHRLLLALDDAFAGAPGLERIYLDLPGFGATPALPGDGGLEELAAWVLAAVRALVPSGPFAIVGNSIGGLLARHVCAAEPARVAGVALLAPAVFADREPRDTEELQVMQRNDELLGRLSPEEREHFTEMAVLQTRESWDRYRRWVLPGIQAADKDAMARLSERYFLPRVPEQDMPLCEAPALIVTGKQDHLVGYRDQFALLEHYPRATYAAIEAAGHNVHVDQPEIVGALLAQWAGELT